MAWSQQETGYDAPLTRLRLHLTADALSDSSWGDANKLLKDVLVGLYEVRSHHAEEVKITPPPTLSRLGLTFSVDSETMCALDQFRSVFLLYIW
jgi:hypothetical protein